MDEIWIGYPIWWYTHPRIIDTFFDNADLAGKKIHLFATSGGSGIDGSVKDLRKAYPELEIVDGKRVDPLTAHLVVADVSRTEKTIRLAVSPALKAYGIPGRGYAKKLEENGMYTMGDVARCSIGKDHELQNEELLYKLFGVNAALETERREKKEARERERNLQEAMLSIRKRYGNDAVIRGLNLQEGATGRERGKQIGGHKA